MVYVESIKSISSAYSDFLVSTSPFSRVDRLDIENYRKFASSICRFSYGQALVLLLDDFSSFMIVKLIDKD